MEKETNAPQLDINWDEVSEKDLAQVAMSNLRISYLASAWQNRSMLSKLMLIYSLLASAVLVIGYKLGYEPLLLAFTNLIIAATFGAVFQFMAQVYETQVKQAVKDQEKFMEGLSKKKVENNT